MKKNIFCLIGLCILICQNAHSQFVPREMALRVAENFIFTQTSTKSQQTMTVHTFGTDEQPTMYAFSTTNS